MESHRQTLSANSATTISPPEQRRFPGSLAPAAARLLAAVRGHWASENNRHWALDVPFDEKIAIGSAKNTHRSTWPRGGTVVSSLAKRDTRSPAS